MWAAELVAERLGLPPIAEVDLDDRLYETRAVEPTPALPDRWPFAFSPDGQSLLLTHRTPRPWALVMANELGASTIVGNDGEVYSAMGNARHNGLTPFRFESATTTLPGQIVYVRDIDAGETDAIGFAPFQREDAEYAVTYEPGVAHLVETARRSGDGLRRVRSDRLSRRHAARHAAQSRPSPSAACASRRSSTLRSTKAPTRASAS